MCRTFRIERSCRRFRYSRGDVEGSARTCGWETSVSLAFMEMRGGRELDGGNASGESGDIRLLLFNRQVDVAISPIERIQRRWSKKARVRASSIKTESKEAYLKATLPVFFIANRFLCSFKLDSSFCTRSLMTYIIHEKHFKGEREKDKPW